MQYVAGHGHWTRDWSRRVIPQVTSHVTKNPKNTGERGASIYSGQKNSEKPAELKKHTLRRWVFRFGFLAVFRGSCLATSNKKLECEKNFFFFYASVNGTSFAEFANPQPCSTRREQIPSDEENKKVTVTWRSSTMVQSMHELLGHPLRDYWTLSNWVKNFTGNLTLTNFVLLRNDRQWPFCTATKSFILVHESKITEIKWLVFWNLFTWTVTCLKAIV